MQNGTVKAAQARIITAVAQANQNNLLPPFGEGLKLRYFVDHQRMEHLLWCCWKCWYFTHILHQILILDYIERDTFRCMHSFPKKLITYVLSADYCRFFIP
jgi:hypothetical protein